MKVLYNWLKEFLDAAALEPVLPKELAGRLSFAGVAIDAVEESAAGPLFDAEITTNRPDLLGHYGVAREVAAILRTTLKPVEPKLKEAAEGTESAVKVEIACPDLCGRFTARVIRGVKVQPSPDGLRQRLEAIGQTSINNVVDATNYVMFELGHALHAFDYDKIAEHRVIIRRAHPGEKMRTLDGVERALRADTCVVADAKRAVSIGGVMGGAETEISSASRNVLLECAWFDPVSVRRTSKALNLRTEASIRFERRADPEMAEVASRRCAELIQQVAGGEILSGVVDVYPGRAPEQTIELTRHELLRVMGADVPDSEIEAILRALGFAPARTDGNRGSRDSLMAAWKCRRPSWRHDVAREVDLVEEVARHYGFDKFPARLPTARQPAARLPHAAAQDALRERLVALGYQEIVSIPLVDEQQDAVFRAAGVTPARISNPLAEDAAVLRTSGAVNMLRALEWNLNRGQRNLRLFEIGRAYALRENQPAEWLILTLSLTGQAREKNIYDAGRAAGFEDLKGDLEALGELCGGFEMRPSAQGWLRPARAAGISCPAAGPAADVGVAGQIARRVAEKFKLRQDVFFAELAFEPLYRAFIARRAALHYQPLPRFPAVERDFSLILDDAVTFERVIAGIRFLKIPEIESVEAVDLFRGGHIPAGRHSLLVRVTFQSHQATLTDAQVADFSGRIAAILSVDLGATLRTA
jgi:phenylalanyl-tRNA synthetase beta chain